jgi:hypothetical protein
MKGTVRIDLFDVNGKLMQTSESENLVTDLADDCINGIASLFKNSSASVVRACAATGLTIIPSTMAGGVLLFDSALANTTDNQATIKTPVGYAGSLYAGDDVKRGSLNTTESGAVENGYKFVWDFATDKANASINSLALTSANAGDAVIRPEDLGGGGNIAKETLEAFMTAKFDLSGQVYLKSTTGYSKQYLSTISFLTGLQSAQTDYTISGYDTFSAPLLLFGKIKIIARDTTTGKYHLLTVTKDTNTVESSIELTNLAEAVSQFGIASNDYILYNPYASYLRVSVKRYQVSTQTVLSAITSGVDAAQGYPFSGPAFRVDSFETDNGTNCKALVGAAECTDQTYRSGECGMIVGGGGIPEGSFNNLGPVFFLNAHPFGVAVAGVGTGVYAIRATRISNALFTNYNLPTTITKTSDKTMKVTYQLNW